MRWVTILFFLLLHLPTWAQVANFQEPDFNQRLTQPFIYSSLTDHNGYLWFGTSEGLFRYNGKQFSKVNFGDQGDQFVSKLEEQENELIVGTNSGNLFLVHLENFSVSKSQFSGKQKITGIVPHKTDLYFSDQRSVYLNNTELHAFTRDTIVTGLFGIQDSELLVCTTRGVFQISELGLTAITDKIISTISFGPNFAILFGRGEYWVKKKGDPAAEWKQMDGLWLPQRVNTSYIDGNTLWVGANNGLFEYTISAGSIISANVYSKVNGLGDFPITNISSAGELIWLGTYGGGMKFFNPKNLFVEYKIPELGTVTTLEVLKSGDVLVGGKKGLALFPEFSTQFQNKPKSSRFIPTESAVTGVQLVGENEVLVATEFSGLYYLDIRFPKGLTKINYSNIESNVEETGIVGIHLSPQNELWISTRVYGIFIYNSSRSFIKQLNVANGLLHNQNPLVFGKEGTWFYPKSAGLTYLPYLSDSSIHYSFNEGIKNLEFSAAFPGEKNEIWLGTDGAGICIGENGVFRHITTKDGLSSNYIIGLNGNDQLRVAISPKSLTIFSPAFIQSITPKQIGFDFFFVPNTIRMLDSINWLYGTENGILLHRYIPSDQPKTGSVLLQHVILNGTDTLADFATENTFPKGNHEMVLELDRISPNPYDEIPLRYRIVGFNKKWEILPTSNTVRIPSIRDGNYVLEIEDQFGQVLLSYDFSIPPPIWKTLWFWLLLFVVLGIVTYYGIQWRIKALTEKNQKLEEMVAERTFLLKLRNRDLEQFSYTLSHDLKNPAGNMIQLVDIIKETFNTSSEEDKEIIELLESSANGMHNKLLSFLEVIKNSQNAPAIISKFPIWDEVEKIRKEFIPSLNAAKAEFICSIPKDVQVEFNREKLISVFHNLISNSIKYRKKDDALVVQVRYNAAGDFHIFEVEDNGLGIDLQSQKEKLFGMFQRIHEHVEGTGVGLNLVKSILENNGGWIDVQSAKGMGSTFFIGIPVVAKVLSPIE